MISIEKGFVIDDPWIRMILGGKKDWEMRSTLTNHRGWFGLIRKGSGLVVGLAFLERTSGRYDNEQLLIHIQHHKVPENHFRETGYNWRYAWHVSNVIKLDNPVRYNHKSGAVTWVKLDVPVSDELAKILLRKQDKVPDKDRLSLKNNKGTKGERALTVTPVTDLSDEHRISQIPMARDGSTFISDTCNCLGKYTIGDKGSERQLTSHTKTLAVLRKMPTARWRRKTIKETGVLSLRPSGWTLIS